MGSSRLAPPGAATCINIIGPQTVVQVVEKLDETMIKGAAMMGRSRAWIIG